MSLDAVVFHCTCYMLANVARCSCFSFYMLHVSECRYTSCCTFQFGSNLAIVVNCCQAPPLTRLIMGGSTLAQKVVFWLKSFCSTSFFASKRAFSFNFFWSKNGYSQKWLQSKMATVKNGYSQRSECRYIHMSECRYIQVSLPGCRASLMDSWQPSQPLEGRPLG